MPTGKLARFRNAGEGKTLFSQSDYFHHDACSSVSTQNRLTRIIRSISRIGAARDSDLQPDLAVAREPQTLAFAPKRKASNLLVTTDSPPWLQPAMASPLKRIHPAQFQIAATSKF